MAVFQEVREGRSKVDSLTRKWYKEVRAAPSESEDEGGGGNVLEMEETSLMTPSNHHWLVLHYDYDSQSSHYIMIVVVSPHITTVIVSPH